MDSGGGVAVSPRLPSASQPQSRHLFREAHQAPDALHHPWTPSCLAPPGGWAGGQGSDPQEALQADESSPVGPRESLCVSPGAELSTCRRGPSGVCSADPPSPGRCPPPPTQAGPSTAPASRALLLAVRGRHLVVSSVPAACGCVGPAGAHVRGLCSPGPRSPGTQAEASEKGPLSLHGHGHCPSAAHPGGRRGPGRSRRPGSQAGCPVREQSRGAPGDPPWAPAQDTAASVGRWGGGGGPSRAWLLPDGRSAPGQVSELWSGAEPHARTCIATRTHVRPTHAHTDMNTPCADTHTRTATPVDTGTPLHTCAR